MGNDIFYMQIRLVGFFWFVFMVDGQIQRSEIYYTLTYTNKRAFYMEIYEAICFNRPEHV